MGNETSEFEQQFHKLYNFIAIVEDPYFKSVKVYRKIRHNFTHIMLVEQPVVHMGGSAALSAKAFLSQKLTLIRRFQNRYTVQLEYFHIIQQNKYQCGMPTVRMYIDYYNYTLLDYLSALRMKKQPLAIDELILVIQSLAEAMLTLRKMGIEQYKITLSNIFLIVEDGVVLLNPIYFLYDTIYQAYNAKAIHSLTQEFDLIKNQLPTIRNVALLETRQKQQIHSIAIQMTRYLNQKCLSQSEGLLQTLDRCPTIADVVKTFVCSIDELNVQQFGESSDEVVQLY